jgi:DNA processing protein
MHHPDLLYQLALSRVPQIGHITARSLLEHFGTAEAIFKAKSSTLQSIDGLGQVRARAIRQFKDFSRSEQELGFISRNNINAISILDKAYPHQLKFCADAPALLFFKGNFDFNERKTVAVIGTRHNSDYGAYCCKNLIEDLAAYEPVIVSGIAYGIDVLAHKTAMQHNLPTIGVVGHGLDSIYPATHHKVAQQAMQNGGLLSEYFSETPADKQHFPARNRIVAGLADVTVVIETGVKGGSVITAELANGYNRDVAAFPGRSSDVRSAGCNYLIRKNKAALITCADDLADLMGWNMTSKPKKVQKQLFVQLNNLEQKLYSNLQPDGSIIHIDELARISEMPHSTALSGILKMEMYGMVEYMPGNICRLL